MAIREKKILITGLPGTGKTTLIIRLADKLKGFQVAGFFTEEIREGGKRMGFRLQSFGGQKGLLSHVGVRGPYRVGKYGVDVAGFEKFLELIPFQDARTKLIIIDEIGKMECLSPKFRKLVTEILDSAQWLIATIALKGSGFISGIKARPDVQVIEMTEKNRDMLLDEILNALHFISTG